MKNLTMIPLVALLFSFAGLACKNPLTGYTKQYRCELPGQSEPQNSNEYLDRGWKHHQDNNYANDPGDCALGACAEAIRLDPKNADAYFCRASMYRDKREFDNALADINDAIGLKPDYARFYGVRGRIYGDKLMFEKGLVDLTRQIELLGDKAADFDYAARGDFYYELGKYEDAVRDYTEAIRLGPVYPRNYTNRAATYEKLGQTDLSDADKKKAEELELADKNKEGGETPGSGLKTPGNTNTSVPPLVSGGVMNGKAISLPTPVYPPAARAARASGAVSVQIYVNEKGEVTAASAVSGHPLLRMAAVQAARATKFPPTMLSGKAVKVTGVLIFNFKLAE